MSFLKRLVAKARKWLRPLPVVTDEMAEYREIVAAVEEQVRRDLEPMPVQIGYDYAFNEHKKRLLREKYGLNWRPTPPRPR